jgi:hypothetical protein
VETLELNPVPVTHFLSLSEENTHLSKEEHEERQQNVSLSKTLEAQGITALLWSWRQVRECK